MAGKPWLSPWSRSALTSRLDQAQIPMPGKRRRRISTRLETAPQALATLALALQWCHHGVRQCALKKAILERDEQAGRANGWESWLPGQRPPSLLGSRWLVSTKAVFIGLTAASIGLAMPDHGVTLWGPIAALIAMTAALLSNPRE